MATRRKSPYEKFWTQYERTLVDVLLSDETTQRQQARLDDLDRRRRHWEAHEQEPENCPWCRRYPGSWS